MKWRKLLRISQFLKKRSAGLGIFVPLYIRLKDIDSVHTDETREVTINLPYHRHITIQLGREHAENLLIGSIS